MPAKLASLIAACTLATLAGCGQQDVISGDVTPDPLAVFLAPSARSELTPEGLFRLENEVGPGEISELRARELAAAFLRTHMDGLKTSLEADRGGEIRIESLTMCGRIFLAETPLEPTPTSIPLPYRRAVGSWWIVNFCGLSGSPEVSLGISSLASDVEIVEGRLRYPPFSGNAFQPLGVASNAPEGYPGTPETAVRRAAHATGRSVANSPRLVWMYGKFPQLAQWRVRLEPPAADQPSTTSVIIADAYVGYDASARATALRVPASQQPSGVDLGWQTFIDGKMSPRVSTRVARKPGYPLEFVPLKP